MYIYTHPYGSGSATLVKPYRYISGVVVGVGFSHRLRSCL